MDTEKKVSIIMGIFNCEQTLEKAITSILAQTYANWELILCDDGSQDKTKQLAKNYATQFPEKIFLLENSENKGLNYTLNKCIAFATGEYIARQDADDYSHPERLEKEVAFLTKHSEFAFVSTGKVHFDETGAWSEDYSKAEPTAFDLLKASPFCHPSCMIRSEVLREVKGYSEGPRLMRVEDYHLWFKIYRAGYKGYNLQELLYFYQDDRAAMKRRTMGHRLNERYVKRLIIRELALPIWQNIFLLRPLLVGLVPIGLYGQLHRMKMQRQIERRN